MLLSEDDIKMVQIEYLLLDFSDTNGKLLQSIGKYEKGFGPSEGYGAGCMIFFTIFANFPNFTNSANFSS